MKLLTTNFNTQQAVNFYNDLQSNNQLYYVFGGNPIPWEDESVPEDVLSNIQNIEYNTYDNMVFGKIISDLDCSLLIKRKDWIYNTVYTIYDDLDINLNKKDFYVGITEAGSYHVFICIDNNNNSPSLYSPAYSETAPDETFYFTADNYQWKYLFSIPLSTLNKFGSPLYIPFVENPAVTGNTNSGTIESIVIVTNDTVYNSYANGFFQEIAVGGNNVIFTIEPTSSANTDFYKGSALKIVQGTGAGQQKVINEYVVSGGQKRVVLDSPFSVVPSLSSQYEISPNVKIDGDGFNARARTIINPISNTISYIEISNTGFGYSYANTTVVGNTGLITSSTGTTLRVILSPPKGFGGDVPKTLFCDTVGISVTIANNELGTIPTTNKYREIGILKNPLFSNVELMLSSTIGTFADGETVNFANTGVTGIVTFYNEASSLLRLKNVTNIITDNIAIYGVTSNTSAVATSYIINGEDKNFNTFDQRTRFGITLTSSNTFIQNEKITQFLTQAEAIVESANTTRVGVTNVRGTFNQSDIYTDYIVSGTSGAAARINDITKPDLIKNSGEVLYLENVQPIQRSNTTSETIKLNITFAAK